jgi:hypothetical protein
LLTESDASLPLLPLLGQGPRWREAERLRIDVRLRPQYLLGLGTKKDPPRLIVMLGRVGARPNAPDFAQWIVVAGAQLANFTWSATC